MLTVIHHPAQLPPGYMIHGWRVVKLLGAGTYGAVYRVEMNGHAFAMKIAMHRPSSGDAEQSDARLMRELGCLVHLRHPNIVGVRGHGRFPDFETGWLYVLLTLVEGHTLAEWMERMHPTAQEVVRLFEKLAGAVDYMHGRGVFHRDLKLSNIMVRAKDNEPVILDFSAGDYTHAEDLTDAPLPPGTRRYRSPEAYRFLKEHGDEKGARYEFKVTDDVYALGVCLYDVLTTPAPASGAPRTPVEGRWVPPQARELNARVPAALSDVGMRFIARSPEERPATAEVMRRELEMLKGEAGPEWTVPVHIPALTPPAAPASNTDEETPPSRRVRRARVVDAGVTLLVVAAVTGAFVWLRPTSPQPVSGEVARQPAAPVAAGDQGRTSLSLVPSLALPEDAGVSPDAGDPRITSSPGVVSPPLAPVRKESPAVKSAPTVASPSTSPAPKAPTSSARREFLTRCAAASAAVALQLGCPSNPQVRPESGACPEEALHAMFKVLHYWKGDSIQVILDEKQPGTQGDEGVYGDGPVTGVVRHGNRELPPGTQLYGRLWTGDGRMLAHYTEARYANGRRYPVCIAIGEDGPVDPGEDSGSKPGEVHFSRAFPAYVVERWP
ncbi:protein kinase [Corallococcus coralloides]|uniref:non-specific serine/threonine protein kinase n=1 Tax=Corallococcus coralloides TaxID=184914 RepID=A0A410S219_CORCK|nr:serine/threonine-protein kinase [Corallococcus coralloides]QAT88249.1 protein kinase [Corallococcus coralloides]